MLKSAVLVVILSTTLTACVANDAQRVLIGAAAGAVAADVTGNDPLLGAGGGAIAGLIIK